MKPSSPPVIPLYRPPTSVEPPDDLDETGTELWRDIQADWVIDDAASLVVLKQACHAADRAETLRYQIETGGQARIRALITAELAARSTLTKLLEKLGVLAAEPKRPHPGRPPKVGGGW